MKSKTPAMEFETIQEFREYRLSIKEKNPRYCLSPLRYMGKCYQCQYFKTPAGYICNSSILVKENQAEREKIKIEKEDLIKRLNAIKEIEKRLGELR